MKNLFTLLTVLFSLSFYTSCSNDPCDDIDCLNDGYCANGACVCPEGYEGADCSQQQTPSRIRITQIDVTSFPPTDPNGGGWDISSGADIYPEVYEGTTLLYSPTTHYPDAINGNVYSFTPKTSLYINNPTSRYTVSLYDYDDLGSDDYMGGVVTTPYWSTNKFPSTLNLDAGFGISFVLHVKYEW